MRPARTSPEELSGLTIEGVAEIDDRLVLMFTDGTYAALGAYGEVVQPAECWELEKDPVRQEIAGAYAAVGLWTNQEYADWQQRRDERHQVYEQNRDRQERAQYERLKAKYGV